MMEGENLVANMSKHNNSITHTDLFIIIIKKIEYLLRYVNGKILFLTKRFH